MPESNSPKLQKISPDPTKKALGSLIPEELSALFLSLLSHGKALFSLAKAETTIWKNTQQEKFISLALFLFLGIFLFVFLNIALFCGLALVVPYWASALILAAIYAIGMLIFWQKFRQTKNTQFLSATREELQSDFQCLETFLKKSSARAKNSQPHEH